MCGQGPQGCLAPSLPQPGSSWVYRASRTVAGAPMLGVAGILKTATAQWQAQRHAGLTFTLTPTSLLLPRVQTHTLDSAKAQKSMELFAEMGSWLHHCLVPGGWGQGDTDICCCQSLEWRRQNNDFGALKDLGSHSGQTFNYWQPQATSSANIF